MVKGSSSRCYRSVNLDLRRLLERADNRLSCRIYDGNVLSRPRDPLSIDKTLHSLRYMNPLRKLQFRITVTSHQEPTPIELLWIFSPQTANRQCDKESISLNVRIH